MTPAAPQTPRQTRPSGSSSASRLGIGRTVVFAAITTIAVLGGLDWGIGALERQGVLSTRAEFAKDLVVEEPLLEADEDWLQTTPYAERSMVEFRFPRESTAFRVALMGGSFAMGAPFAHSGPNPSSPEVRVPGSLPFWLEKSLAARLNQTVEVLPFAGVGVDSGWLSTALTSILDLDPDVVVVLTCNNEMPRDPADKRTRWRWLRGRPLFRLLARGVPLRLGKPELEPHESLEHHLASMLEEIHRAGIPVVTGIPPVRHRFDWFPRPSAWFSRDSREVQPNGTKKRQLHPQPGDSLEDILSLQRKGDPSCRSWLRLVVDEQPLSTGIVDPPPGNDEVERLRAASQRCAHPFFEQAATFKELKSGRGPERHEILEPIFGPCTLDGLRLYYAGSYAEAADALEQCDTGPARYWRELARWEQDRDQGGKDEMLAALQETLVCNCGPGRSEAIRRVSDTRGVAMVDLDSLFVEKMPDGLPGSDWFLDHCHVNWRGYAHVAEALAAAIATQVTGEEQGTRDENWMEAIGKQHGLREDGFEER